MTSLLFILCTLYFSFMNTCTNSKHTHSQVLRIYINPCLLQFILFFANGFPKYWSKPSLCEPKYIPLPTVWICFRSKSYVRTLNKIYEKIHKVNYFSQVIIDLRCLYSIFGEVFIYVLNWSNNSVP